jgi:hypothetical protein
MSGLNIPIAVEKGKNSILNMKIMSGKNVFEAKIAD